MGNRYCQCVCWKLSIPGIERAMKIRHCAREACINMREEELESICGKYALAKGIAVLLEEAGKDQ
ncbi:hypothetical protein T11_10348 [Trichinella zimbabwensis]|uniref:Uncharacterized protein n=1 Tax=Trichinella zimbabwensis TaxID=268475 RepID=A0A0V1HEP5_9BILA|nr:hypothetical protein T11_12000 [Trichinella zimbabwensis]KRZ12265.1 hypothetical protein T11_10348 [Trichinella zimbabwensis]